VGSVQVSILEAFEAVKAVSSRPHRKCAAIVERFQDSTGLPGSYAYEMLLDLARPWTVPIQLVAFHGNFGSRSFPAAAPRYTEARLTVAGELVLAAERREMPPVPVGLINGTTYKGSRPPLNPGRATAALRLLISNPKARNNEVLDLVGLPDFLTGCDISGRLQDYMAGKPTALRLRGRVEVEDERTVVIRSLPPNASPAEVTETIRRRLNSPAWAKEFPALDKATRLDIAEIRDLSRGDDDLRLACLLRPGVDAQSFADRLQDVAGVVTEVAVDLKTPLADQLRSWTATWGAEDLSHGLDELETAISSARL